VFRFNKPKIANFRADYAKHDDFCAVFAKDTRSLYLLAFLLVTNHGESEQCFTLTIEEAFKEHAVFKDRILSWVKCKLIENAIKIVSPASTRSDPQRDPWNAGQHRTQGEREIDTVTKLAPFERFVFVMSILERYSNCDCALLLGCSKNKVAQAKMKALRRLADFATFSPRGDGLPMRWRQAGA
jgi:DNA-directed RNA polymerase specialized sigma24 family protein